MKKVIGALLSIFIGIALSLLTVWFLVAASVHNETIANPFLEAAAIAAELVLGVCFLMLTVFVSTRIALRFFRRVPAPPLR